MSVSDYQTVWIPPSLDIAAATPAVMESMFLRVWATALPIGLTLLPVALHSLSVILATDPAACARCLGRSLHELIWLRFY